MSYHSFKKNHKIPEINVYPFTTPTLSREVSCWVKLAWVVGGRVCVSVRSVRLCDSVRLCLSTYISGVRMFVDLRLSFIDLWTFYQGLYLIPSMCLPVWKCALYLFVNSLPVHKSGVENTNMTDCISSLLNSNKHLPQILPFTGRFFRWRHFALVSI